MRQIFDGKVYDTKKAEKIATWDNGLLPSDFRSCEETCYKTTNGRWFLYGEGGPMTEYREECGNRSWSAGNKLVPLSNDEAFEWLSAHASVDVVRQHFPEKLTEA